MNSPTLLVIFLIISTKKANLAYLNHCESQFAEKDFYFRNARTPRDRLYSLYFSIKNSFLMTGYFRLLISVLKSYLNKLQEQIHFWKIVIYVNYFENFAKCLFCSIFLGLPWLQVIFKRKIIIGNETVVKVALSQKPLTILITWTTTGLKFQSIGWNFRPVVAQLIEIVKGIWEKAAFKVDTSRTYFHLLYKSPLF